mmetsp:Transcript_145293/g.253576  ORF Transcript_145293/g.253576 Transcript_145293/m.253576 type:complete len:84 (+) Transcript_145293:724-975(+)
MALWQNSGVLSPCVLDCNAKNLYEDSMPAMDGNVHHQNGWRNPLMLGENGSRPALMLDGRHSSWEELVEHRSPHARPVERNPE